MIVAVLGVPGVVHLKVGALLGGMMVVGAVVVGGGMGRSLEVEEEAGEGVTVVGVGHLGAELLITE
jgi:hypothetical protein